MSLWCGDDIVFHLTGAAPSLGKANKKFDAFTSKFEAWLPLKKRSQETALSVSTAIVRILSITANGTKKHMQVVIKSICLGYK